MPRGRMGPTSRLDEVYDALQDPSVPVTMQKALSRTQPVHLYECVYTDDVWCRGGGPAAHTIDETTCLDCLSVLHDFGEAALDRFIELQLPDYDTPKTPLEIIATYAGDQ